jgi:hypothetical protein
MARMRAALRPVVLDRIVRHEAGGVREESVERNRADLGVPRLGEMLLERIGEPEPAARRLLTTSGASP